MSKTSQEVKVSRTETEFVRLAKQVIAKERDYLIYIGSEKR